MDRMYALFAPIAIMSLGGAFVIAALAFGAATWVAFVASAVVALLIGAPFSYWMTRRIKRKDPGYPPPADRANP